MCRTEAASCRDDVVIVIKNSTKPLCTCAVLGEKRCLTECVWMVCRLQKYTERTIVFRHIPDCCFFFVSLGIKLYPDAERERHSPFFWKHTFFSISNCFSEWLHVFFPCLTPAAYVSSTRAILWSSITIGFAYFGSKILVVSCSISLCYMLRFILSNRADFRFILILSSCVCPPPPPYNWRHNVVIRYIPNIFIKIYYWQTIISDHLSAGIRSDQHTYNG